MLVCCGKIIVKVLFVTLYPFLELFHRLLKDMLGPWGQGNVCKLGIGVYSFDELLGL